MPRSRLAGYAVATPPQSGNNNPDGYPESGTIFYQSDFNTEVAADVQTGGGVVTTTWGSEFGRGSSGGWRISPVLAAENNVGYRTGTGVAAVDAYRRIFVSFTLRINAAYRDVIKNSSGSSAMKFLDVRQYLANGSGLDGTNGNTRWVTFIGRINEEEEPSKIHFGIAAGGAGTPDTNDGVNTNPDLVPFISTDSEPPWFCIVYDEQNVIAKLFMKRVNESGVTKLLERDGSPGSGEHLESNGRGFGVGERTIAGYIRADIAGFALDGSEWYVLDDLVIANYWTGPVY